MTFAGRYLEREARDAEVYKSTAPLMPAASAGDALHATL